MLLSHKRHQAIFTYFNKPLCWNIINLASLKFVAIQILKKKLSQHIKMVNLSEYALRLTAKNRGVKNYKNMTREKLLSTLDEIERNLNTISERELNKIRKCRIFHIMIQIKSWTCITSCEELIISLLKSKHDLAELSSNNLDDSKISDIRRILNRLRDVPPKRIRKEIKKKL